MVSIRYSVPALGLALLLVLGPAAAGPPAAAPACNDPGTQASYFYLAASQSPLFPQCDIPLPGLSFELIDVRLATTPIARARFSIPDPPVGTILGESWNYPHTGDRINGLELDLGTCPPTGVVVLGTLLVGNLPSSIGVCAWWRIDDGAEVDYCTGETRAITPWYQGLTTTVPCSTCPSWQWCAPLPPHDLSPPDGAVEVPLDAQLSCDAGNDVWISTDPTCATGQTFRCGELPPGFLQPGTTYYWQVGFEITSGDGCSNVLGMFRSAMHSFTTTAVVATDTRTWGAIKALYD